MAVLKKIENNLGGLPAASRHTRLCDCATGRLYATSPPMPERLVLTLPCLSGQAGLQSLPQYKVAIDYFFSTIFLVLPK